MSAGPQPDPQAASISSDDVSRMFLTAAENIRKHEGELTDIDTQYGDGDHGASMVTIAGNIEDAVRDWGDDLGRDIQAFLGDLGKRITSAPVGSLAPLFGALVGGMSNRLSPGTLSLLAKDVKDMFAGSVDEMQTVTKAVEGDATMMDALIPAASAVSSAPEGTPPDQMFQAAAMVARSGAEKTRNSVSKYGKASEYGEDTVGTPDAGAISTALFFEGLADGLAAGGR